LPLAGPARAGGRNLGYIGASVTDIVMGAQSGYPNHAGSGTIRLQAVPNWWVGFFPLVHAAAAAGACTSCGSYDVPVLIAGIVGARWRSPERSCWCSV
jgi:hypothetical protein